jgi:hypothetical protein
VTDQGEEGNQNKEEEEVIDVHAKQFYKVVILNASTVTLQYAPAAGYLFAVAFKLRFSFHPLGRVPQHVGRRGLYNCSVDYFSTFRHHLDCDRRQDCEAGQDEGDHCFLCPPGQAALNRTCPFCLGGRTAPPGNGKCYVSAKLDRLPEDFDSFLPLAHTLCQGYGMRLAVLRSVRDLLSVSLGNDMFTECFDGDDYEFFGSLWSTPYDVHQIGLFYGGHRVPSIYRQVLSLYITFEPSSPHPTNNTTTDILHYNAVKTVNTVL